MSLFEDSRATWEKRYKQIHYGYRDFHQVLTSVLTEALAVAAFVVASAQGFTVSAVHYIFGTNAKLKINPITGLPYGTITWPQDPLNPLHACFGREVMVLCDQNAWISFISLNPEYIRQATLQSITGEAPTATQFIVEEEQYLPAGTIIVFRPTLGYGIIFRADTVAGTLNIWIEGNTEGGE